MERSWGMSMASLLLKAKVQHPSSFSLKANKARLIRTPYCYPKAITMCYSSLKHHHHHQDEDEEKSDPLPASALSQDFSRLPSNISIDYITIVSNMISYFGFLHIPLGLGGMSILAELFHMDDFKPETKGILLVFLELLELGGSIWLIESSKELNSGFSFIDFNFKEISGRRGWLLTSGLGFASVIVGMWAITLLGQTISHQMDSDDEALRGILSGGIEGKVSILLVYCLVAPFLEEFIYRGFLLRSLAAHINWWVAVLISAGIFTVSHWDLSSSPGLFLVGCILGTAYAWTGNLASSLIIHISYNAFVLASIMTI